MKTGPIGEALEILQEEVEQGVATAKQQVTGKPFGKAQGKQQQGVQPKQQGKLSDAGQQLSATDQVSGIPSETTTGQQPQDEATKQFVQDLYGAKTPPMSEQKIEQNKLEDKQKEEALRQKLHSEYYQRLTNPGLAKEPSVQEKLEMEKKEEEEKKIEEEEKKPKDLPILVTKDMGTKEKLRGVSG